MTSITAIDPHVEGSLAELLDVLGRTGDAMVAIGSSFGIIASFVTASARLLSLANLTKSLVRRKYSAGPPQGRPFG
jgi:hypothetical protein